MDIFDIIGQILAIIGAAIFIAAGIGLNRLPDPYMRASAVATAAGLGVAFVVVGVALTNPSLSAGIKVTLAVLLQLATSAVGSMTLGRAAALSGHAFAEGTDTSDLDTTERQEKTC